jgi:hypothetical protein
MFALASLLYYDLQGGDMLFEIYKPRREPRLLDFKQHFDTEEERKQKYCKVQIFVFKLSPSV